MAVSGVQLTLVMSMTHVSVWSTTHIAMTHANVWSTTHIDDVHDLWLCLKYNSNSFHWISAILVPFITWVNVLGGRYVDNGRSFDLHIFGISEVNFSAKGLRFFKSLLGDT